MKIQKAEGKDGRKAWGGHDGHGSCGGWGTEEVWRDLGAAGATPECQMVPGL